MLTENADIAHRSTTDPLLDLFSEMEDVISGHRLMELLRGAWAVDPTATLKIIFNARSIPLGKASRPTFYRCAGWLAKNHPQTLIASLAWLCRPVIQKKLQSKNEEYDMVMVEEGLDDNDPACFDVKHGVTHGYWKDLPNLVTLQLNEKLDILVNPREILNIETEKGRAKWPKTQQEAKWPKTQQEAKSKRHGQRDARHETAVKLFNESSTYRGLHLAVARLFAAQLKTDLALLAADDPTAKHNISLCAKWAPSSDRFADKHTFIVSSIAEIMHSQSEFKGFGDYDSQNIEQRTFYLRHARDAYRKDVSALRKQLEVVERDITANTYNNIKYDHPKRFETYIDKVADGKARISGATLLPSTLVKLARQSTYSTERYGTVAGGRKRKGTKGLVDARGREMAGKALDGQWRTLVQRIKDSGTLENCIAVANVSGSMLSPGFPDGTTPMDSSIGLSLLIAEVCKPPFGGALITFSTNPTVEKIDLSAALREKVNTLSGAHWEMSTDFVAVFEKLILPMAVGNQLKQEDMVKRIFVFSNMQFNQAANHQAYRSFSESKNREAWSPTSYERIQKKFQDAGYEMPELVFWNLAGGRAGYQGGTIGGDPVAPKPVTAMDEGTAIVSGYSQGMLKVFLDGGSFEDEDAEEQIVEKVDKEAIVVMEKAKRQKLDPLSVVKKAIDHKAYAMLRVID